MYIALNISLQSIYLFASKRMTHIEIIFMRQHARHMNANLYYVLNKLIRQEIPFMAAMAVIVLMVSQLRVSTQD